MFSGEQNYSIRWEFCTSKYWIKCQDLLKIRWLHGQLDIDHKRCLHVKKKKQNKNVVGRCFHKPQWSFWICKRALARVLAPGRWDPLWQPIWTHHSNACKETAKLLPNCLNSQNVFKPPDNCKGKIIAHIIHNRHNWQWLVHSCTIFLCCLDGEI